MKRVNSASSDSVLTAQQEAFAQAVAAGETQSAAFRRIYPHSSKWQSKSVHEEASRLAVKVASRIAALRQKLREKSEYGLEQAMAEANEALGLAKRKENSGDMVRAIALKAKMNGLLVEDRRNAKPPLADLDDAQLDAEIARAQTEIERASTIH